jgi:hypothetical protein
MVSIFQLKDTDWWIGLPNKINWSPVAHDCNPSYWGGRDQEDHDLKTAPANSLWDPISKKKKLQKKD